MKLGSKSLRYHRLTQLMPWFHHERELVGAPLLDVRLHPMGTCGIYAHAFQSHAGAGCGEPPSRIKETDPSHGHLLACGRWLHDHADQVVDHGQDRQLLQGVTGETVR